MSCVNLEQLLSEKGFKLPLSVIAETDKNKRTLTIHLLRQAGVGYKHSQELFFEMLKQHLDAKVNFELAYTPIAVYINVTLHEGELVMMPGESLRQEGSVINYEQLCEVLGCLLDSTCLIGYTIAVDERDICTDILYDSQEQAVSEAVENGVAAFKFEWDGVDAQSMTSIEKLTD